MTNSAEGAFFSAIAGEPTANWFPLVLAQADKGPANAPAPGGAQGSGSIFDAVFGNPMLFVMITLMLAYLLLFRPDSRKNKQQEEMLANLKDNDHVITSGGICGVIVSTSKNSVVLRVDDKTGTKIKVLRTAIYRVGSPDEAAEEEAKAAK